MGHWSNGPTWIEVAASQLGADLTDYGAAVATTGSVLAREFQDQKTTELGDH
jgi:hypothetical protein